MSIRILMLVLVFPVALCAKEEYILPFYPPYYSQCGQDKFLQEKIFKSQENGTFVEIGAHDGVTRSNTYFFEKNFNWTGICIEPHPDRFEELVHNRASKTVCLPIAIANFTGVSNFKKVSGYAEMLSGLENCYDQRHQQRIEQEVKKFGGEAETIEIQVEKLGDVLMRYGITKVDLLSVDTEGSELEILKSIDFKQVEIRVILVENNYHDQSIFNYLVAQGYFKFASIDADDIYVKRS